jgi:hypothetical protein
MADDRIQSAQVMMTAAECHVFATAAGVAARAEPNGERRNILYNIMRAWESLAKQTESLEGLDLK